MEDHVPFIVELTHVATQTSISITTDQNGDPLVGDGDEDVIYLSAQEIDAIGQGAISVSVMATDPAGNTSPADLGQTNLVLKTGTFLMENGVVSAQQVKGVQGDGYQSDGTIIRPFDGSLAGEGDTIDFSQELGDTDITYLAEAGLATSTSQEGTDYVEIETNNPDTAEHEAFETIITGDGDDYLVGSSLASETFVAGGGDNVIEAGDSEGTVDTVSYENLVNDAVSQTTTLSKEVDAENGTLRIALNQTGTLRSTIPTQNGSETLSIQLNQLSDLAVLVSVLGSAAHAAEMRVPNAEDINAKIVDGNVLEISAFDAQGQAIPVSDFADLFNFEIESSIAGVNADLGTILILPLLLLMLRLSGRMVDKIR